MVVLPAPFGPSRANTRPRLDGEVHLAEHTLASERLRDPDGINCVFHTQNSI